MDIKTANLLPFAPRYHEWVKNLFAAHAAQTQSVCNLPFTRLPQYFQTTTLANARYVVVDKLPKFPFADFGLPIPPGMEGDGFDGVTYANTYYVVRGQEQRESLHFHELVHVAQWHILGPDLQPLLYAMEAYAKSYRQNFFEKMAYDMTDLFNKNGPSFQADVRVAYQLGHYLPALLDQSIKGQL